MKAVLFVGNTRNGQAYLAVPEGMSVKTNLLTLANPVQPDHFVNTFTQLQYSYQMGTYWTLNISPYLLTNNGNYDFPYDLTNGNLAMNSKTAGGFLNVKYDTRKLNFILGANGSYFRVYNTYTHLPSELLYKNSTIKTDVNIYTRVSYLLTQHFRLSGDLQARSVSSEYTGSTNVKLYNSDGALNFFNYSFGISVPFTSRTPVAFINDRLIFSNVTQFEAYVNFSEVSREPTKTNMFVNIPSGNVELGNLPITISPERNRDLEFGLKMKSSEGLCKFDIKVNGFYMNMNHEMLSSGSINSIGAFTGYSVPKSQRIGLELESKYDWYVLQGGVNFSYQNSKYWLSNGSTKTPLLSPNEILYIYQGVSYKGFKATLSYQFVASSLINNEPKVTTNNVNQLNLNLGYTYKSISFDLLVYNLTNKNQTLGGYYDGSRNFYYSAGVSAYGSIKVKF